MPDQKISPCFMPTKEGKPCGGECELVEQEATWDTWGGWIACDVCEFRGPYFNHTFEAIDLHNLTAERLEVSQELREIESRARDYVNAVTTLGTDKADKEWDALIEIFTKPFVPDERPPATCIETGITPNTVDEIRAAVKKLILRMDLSIMGGGIGKVLTDIMVVLPDDLDKILDQASRGELEKIT